MAKTNADIEHWDVESEEFWEREGKKSPPATCGFPSPAC